jgi:hypothetical protein
VRVWVTEVPINEKKPEKAASYPHILAEYVDNFIEDCG